MNYANMIEEKNLKKTFIIATLVSTIIGTFTTGMGLYERLELKRKQKGVDQTQNKEIGELKKKLDAMEEKTQKSIKQAKESSREEALKDSLQQSGPMIRQEYNRDFARFGDRFAQGDHITENQLQGQVIMLQGTVIQLLDEALRTGRLDNINKLYNASELARDGSLAALQQQYQRMLQAAPVQRPVAVRRISSTPSVAASKRSTKSLQPASGKTRTMVQQKTVINDSPDEPLFCRYSYNLQRDHDKVLDKAFLTGGNNGCDTCGAILDLEPGRAWKVNKEVIREKISTPEYDEEVIEDRTYLVGNRFVVKSHRGVGGYACPLCARYRDKDTLLEAPSSLIRHVWQKHTVEEYTDPDIKEIGQLVAPQEVVHKYG